jgi:hypothetical protein
MGWYCGVEALPEKQFLPLQKLRRRITQGAASLLPMGRWKEDHENHTQTKDPRRSARCRAQSHKLHRTLRLGPLLLNCHRVENSTHKLRQINQVGWAESSI